MSLFKRIFGLNGDDAPEEASGASAGTEEASDRGPAAIERVNAELADTPETRLQSLVRSPPAALDEEQVLDLLSQLRVEGREARGLELCRRLLAHFDGLPNLAMRVSELLASRGDDAAAALVLERFMQGHVKFSPAAFMLAGEIAERRGDGLAALTYYERVLAMDIDYPGGQERVQRLRDAHRGSRGLAGQTLLVDGALARGRYRIEREIGRGGAGTAFAARDLRLDRMVALKVYHQRGRADRQRLFAEGRTPADLEHPGVVRIFDLDLKLGAIAMEWVRGGSIRAELKRGAIPYERALRWMSSGLEALAFVHDHGYVHRDIKPSNFLLREDNRVVLTDFGLALARGAPAEAQGLGEGTLAYMPPEQRRGAAPEPAADIFAFGASMREILSAVPIEVPAELLEVLAACSRSDPAARPTAASLWASVDRL